MAPRPQREMCLPVCGLAAALLGQRGPRGTGRGGRRRGWRRGRCARASAGLGAGLAAGGGALGRLGLLVLGLGFLAALFRRFESRETEIALRCLDHVGLLDRAWKRTDTLSGGEQQRVAIAKILAQDPSLILADEPIASLDLVNGELVMGTLQRIARDLGLSVVATLHHVDFARRYADRVLGFQAGRLVFDGIPADLCDEALRELFGAGPADSPPPEVQPIAAFQLVTS